MKSAVTLFSVVAALSACRNTSQPRLCTTELVNALGITVRDSATNAPAALNVTATYHIVSDRVDAHGTGQVIDSLLIFVGQLPGTYDVTLSKAGYANWVRSGVEVRASDAEGCHPQPVGLEARLQRLP